MSFHLGKPILVMLFIAAVTGAGMWLRPAAGPRADLTLWVFADMHARTYRGELQRQYEARFHSSFDLQLLAGRAEDLRLESIFMSGLAGPEAPDLAEIEIGQVGKFFRPPLSEMGFIPLNDYLEKAGLMDKIVKARFAPWSKEGKIFGIPHDVHPVTLSYRKDLFDQAGVDLEQPRTWAEFQDACLKFQAYWTAHGRPDRHAVELPASDSGDLVVMLLQRHVNPIDDFNRIHLEDPRVAQTLAFYAQLVAGPRSIGAQSSGGEGAIAQDLNDGNICAFITPDWRISTLKSDTAADPKTGLPILQGKMRMRPLPIFEPKDAPTSTWGGTMLGILKSSKHKDEAWQLAQFLYFSREGIEARRRETDILPPVTSFWDDEYYQRPDPYFGGQKVDALYVELARQIPDRYVTPATPIASAILSVALHRACNYVKSNGTDGLEAACQEWLKEGAQDLQRRIDHGRFDDLPTP